MKRTTHERSRLLAHLAGSRIPRHDDEYDEIFRQFVHHTMAFATRMQDIRKALGRTIGLSGTRYTILISIARRGRKGGVGLSDIADRLHFTPAFLTIEANKLAADGLIAKRENPDDRRRVLLSITPKARELLRSVRTVQEPANSLLFGDLSSDDFDLMRRKMLELVDNSERALGLIELLSGPRGRQD
jgi:DNA-binding MarR family transcriptional regulator